MCLILGNSCLVWNEPEFFFMFIYCGHVCVLTTSRLLKLIMFKFLYLFIFCLCVHVGVRGQFCPSTKWIQGSNSGSGFYPVCHPAWPPPHFFFFHFQHSVLSTFRKHSSSSWLIHQLGIFWEKKKLKVASDFLRSLKL